MNENMRFWDAGRTPPKSALKPIQAGRLRGKSDINPQWRMQRMTEIFGPCGVGWIYEIIRMWTEAGADSEVCAFVQIALKVKDANGIWSEPIPGIGGNALITKESRGLYTNDEAFKMALTDALSVAMKALGIAADVYLGFDSTKYSQNRPSNQPDTPPPASGRISERQKRLIEAKIKEYGLVREGVKAAMRKLFHVEHFNELSPQQMESLLKHFPEWAKK